MNFSLRSFKVHWGIILVHWDIIEYYRVSLGINWVNWVSLGYHWVYHRGSLGYYMGSLGYNLGSFRVVGVDWGKQTHRHI